MTTSADMLWHVNNEYRLRLSSARKYLDLLEQLLLARHGEAETLVLEILHYAQAQVSALRASSPPATSARRAAATSGARSPK